MQEDVDMLLEEFRKAQSEVEKQTEKKAVTQKMFTVV